MAGEITDGSREITVPAQTNQAVESLKLDEVCTGVEGLTNRFPERADVLVWTWLILPDGTKTLLSMGSFAKSKHLAL